MGLQGFKHIRLKCIEGYEVEKAGLEVVLKEHSDYTMPEELQDAFNEMPDFQTAFEALTPGGQRAYILQFSAPKQSKTRVARIEKYTQQIFEGKGLND
ncbi:MAG: YdeI/OmpD-associated family protein [Vallitaleaceae bacterium]|nr:YdeI/OmpD-associated family protein [Vallitaleaceae bacterium]